MQKVSDRDSTLPLSQTATPPTQHRVRYARDNHISTCLKLQFRTDLLAAAISFAMTTVTTYSQPTEMQSSIVPCRNMQLMH